MTEKELQHIANMGGFSVLKNKPLGIPFDFHGISLIPSFQPNRNDYNFRHRANVRACESCYFSQFNVHMPNSQQCAGLPYCIAPSRSDHSSVNFIPKTL